MYAYISCNWLGAAPLRGEATLLICENMRKSCVRAGSDARVPPLQRMLKVAGSLQTSGSGRTLPSQAPDATLQRALSAQDLPDEISEISTQTLGDPDARFRRELELGARGWSW